MVKALFRVINRFLAKLSRKEIVLFGYGLVAALGLLDFITGYEVSISVFYLVPVAILSWYAGRGHGILASLLSAGSWLVANQWAGQTYSHEGISFWNAAVRLGFFLTGAILTSALREYSFRERYLKMMTRLLPGKVD